MSDRPAPQPERLSRSRLLETLHEVRWEAEEPLRYSLPELLSEAESFLGRPEDGVPNSAERDRAPTQCDQRMVLAKFLAFQWRGRLVSDRSSPKADAVRAVYRVLASVRQRPVRLGPCLEASAAEVADWFGGWLSDTANEHFNLQPFGDAVEQALIWDDPDLANRAEGGPSRHLLPRCLSDSVFRHQLFAAGLGDSGAFEFLERAWLPGSDEPAVIARLRGSPAVQESARNVLVRPFAEWLLGVTGTREVRRAAAELELECARAERLLRGTAGFLSALGRGEDAGHQAGADRTVGPVPPCWFYWQGERHRVKPGRTFALLKYTWGRDAAAVADVLAAVWPDAVLEGSVGACVSRLNASLPAGYPRRLARRGNYLTWVDSD
jgi:hypothetical protein